VQWKSETKTTRNYYVKAVDDVKLVDSRVRNLEKTVQYFWLRKFQMQSLEVEEQVYSVSQKNSP